MAESIVRKKSYAFALVVIKLCKELNDEKEFVLSKQLLRSGTSIGANVEEALAAQSRRDFISKMGIASKEARETIYWLRLIRDAGLAKAAGMSDVLNEAEALSRMLASIVKTTKEPPEGVCSFNSKLKTHNS